MAGSEHGSGVGEAAKPQAEVRGRQSVAGDPRIPVAEASLGASAFAIRIPAEVGWQDCRSCGATLWAAGPTGFAGHRPICDLCLLRGCWELGLLLALAAVTRAYGALRLRSPREWRAAQGELGTFARVYARLASLSGPAREFTLPTDPEP